MEHIDLEKKIQVIRKALEIELKQAKVIDSKGKATNLKTFEKIIDKKLEELQGLDYLVTDEAGVAKNRYSANILMHNIELLNNMRKRHSVLPTNESLVKKEKAEDERLNKKSVFSNAKTKVKGFIKKMITPRTEKNKSR